MSTAWDPDQYRRFANERAQPFWDLVGLVDGSAPIQVAVDLGCGSGELTLGLAQRFGIARMVGVDNSTTMLAAAAEHVAANTGGDPSVQIDLRHGDIAEWTADGGHDLILANASLHWVPDHAAVLARWADALALGGQLAVQIPANADHPSHRVAAEVAATEPFASAFEGDPPPDPVAANVLAPEEYATLLHDLGLGDQHVRLQVYPHVLDRSADVVEWVRGTSLTRFGAVLPPDLFDEFLSRYRVSLLDVIGDSGPYFYAFKRILLWARRPSQ